jgi:hypothetical protein
LRILPFLSFMAIASASGVNKTPLTQASNKPHLNNSPISSQGPVNADKTTQLLRELIPIFSIDSNLNKVGRSLEDEAPLTTANPLPNISCPCDCSSKDDSAMAIATLALSLLGLLTLIKTIYDLGLKVKTCIKTPKKRNAVSPKPLDTEPTLVMQTNGNKYNLLLSGQKGTLKDAIKKPRNPTKP